MASQQDLGQILRRAVDTNVRFYNGMVELYVDYLKTIGDIITASPTTQEPSSPHEAPATANSAAAIVLEGLAGETARSHFLVANKLNREVSARVTISPITDEQGREVELAVLVEPDTLTMQPGDQVVVTILASIDQSLNIGEAYRGSVTVPNLSNMSANILIRRLPENV